MLTTAHDVAEMARAAGMKKGNMLLKVEDFRACAAHANEQGNAELGKGNANLCAEKFAEQDHWMALADLYLAAARLM